MQDHVARVRAEVARHREAMLTFFREIVAIPSMNSDIKAVSQRVAQEMRMLGYDDVWWDKMGSVCGRIGDGERVLLYDSHLDTVGVGELSDWAWHPFEGKVENGVLFARGACDEKGSTPPMLYGLAIARDLGLLEGWTVYYFGGVEEWNEGSAPHAFVQTEGIRPHFVVVGEPTNLQVYLGQKGRVEFTVTAFGKGAHAASPHLGDNALYKLLPVIEHVRALEAACADDPFLGRGQITCTDLHVHTTSVNAVPHQAVLHIDRRLTVGEDAPTELARLRAWVGEREDLRVDIPIYDEPSYTGFVFPLPKVYPTWLMDMQHPLVRAGVALGERVFGTCGLGKWDFSTNGVYWQGKAGIPTIGFAPGEERYAHTRDEQIRLDDVVAAAVWYALLPAQLMVAEKEF